MQNDKEKFKKEFIARTINFTIKTIRIGNKIKRADYFLKSIIDQLIRSAASIGANVVEAKAASSTRDYIKFFEIALKSANETIYWLMILEKTVNADCLPEIEKLYQEALEISKIIGASVLTLKHKR